jgi:hypothetical protein
MIGMLQGAASIALASVLAAQSGPAPDRIYGRVLTAGGERLEGYLRWDRNETQWTDFLDGEKEIAWAWLREAERLDDEYRRRRARERSITLLGVRISWDEDDDLPPPTSSAAVRFGHLRSLVVLGERSARVVLKSGEEVVLHAAGSDLGGSFRGLVVEDRTRGEVELRWSDLDRIDFLAAPPDAPPAIARRLHGTLFTRAGREFTGFVAWDLDEAVTSDVLDGEEEGREHRIPFGEIAAVERLDARSARVVLTTGETRILRGTNDVNERNRGIEVSTASFGRVIVPWQELASLRLHAAEGARGYDAFDGGRPLRGTVETVDGTRLVGRIRWDNDEESSWEVTDGRADGIDYDIELGHVARIERVGLEAARVTLRDGGEFLLEGSSDVDASNRGLFVTPAEGGETVLVRWRSVARVTFEP